LHFAFDPSLIVRKSLLDLLHLVPSSINPVSSWVAAKRWKSLLDQRLEQEGDMLALEGGTNPIRA